MKIELEWLHILEGQISHFVESIILTIERRFTSGKMVEGLVSNCVFFIIVTWHEYNFGPLLEWDGFEDESQLVKSWQIWRHCLLDLMSGDYNLVPLSALIFRGGCRQFELGDTIKFCTNWIFCFDFWMIHI